MRNSSSAGCGHRLSFEGHCGRRLSLILRRDVCACCPAWRLLIDAGGSVVVIVGGEGGVEGVVEREVDIGLDLTVFADSCTLASLFTLLHLGSSCELIWCLGVIGLLQKLLVDLRNVLICKSEKGLVGQRTVNVVFVGARFRGIRSILYLLSRLLAMVALLLGQWRLRNRTSCLLLAGLGMLGLVVRSCRLVRCFMLVLLSFGLAHVGTKLEVFEGNYLLDCPLEIWINWNMLLLLLLVGV